MSTSRRSFIKNSALTIAAAAILPHSSLLAPGKKINTPAIQLFAFGKEMYDDTIGTLRALEKIGYRYVEHANYTDRKFYGFSPSDFSKLLNDCGLTLLSGHSVLEMQHWNRISKVFNREWHYTIEDAASAGQQYLITPWIDPRLWNDERGFHYFMDVFNKSGELCKSAGLQFGYHNHDFEFTHSFNSLKLYDIILQHTSPNLVCQQLDIANFCLHGYTIKDLFSRYPGRFQLMHVKDLIKTSERGYPFKVVPMGEGIIDIKHIIANAPQQGGTSCFIIDQHNDQSNDSILCANKNFDYFNEFKIA